MTTAQLAAECARHYCAHRRLAHHPATGACELCECVAFAKPRKP